MPHHAVSDREPPPIALIAAVFCWMLVATEHPTAASDAQTTTTMRQILIALPPGKGVTGNRARWTIQ